MQWEKELTPDAAQEDAIKFFTSLSEVLREMVVYYLIFPRAIRDLYYFEIRDIELERDDFFQFLLERLGFNRTYFDELLIAIVKNVYEYIVSDLDSCELSFEYDELIKTWSRLLYLLYPVISPHYRKEFHASPKRATPKIEINIYSDEVLSTAVSPRFMYALRMLTLRQHVVGSLTPPYVIDIQGQPVEYTPLPPEQLSKEIATILEESNTLSAPDLAFLASVSYPFVTKLVRAGKIPARKKGKFILIPIETAVAFAISRSTAPKWLRTLANREKIAPLNV